MLCITCGKPLHFVENSTGKYTYTSFGAACVSTLTGLADARYAETNEVILRGHSCLPRSFRFAKCSQPCQGRTYPTGRRPVPTGHCANRLRAETPAVASVDRLFAVYRQSSSSSGVNASLSVAVAPLLCFFSKSCTVEAIISMA